MTRITRDRYLTPEETATYGEIKIAVAFVMSQPDFDFVAAAFRPGVDREGYDDAIGGIHLIAADTLEAAVGVIWKYGLKGQLCLPFGQFATELALMQGYQIPF